MYIAILHCYSSHTKVSTTVTSNEYLMNTLKKLTKNDLIAFGKFNFLLHHES